MLLVIVGAGASYDSMQSFTLDYPADRHTTANLERAGYRPPLTNELFSNRDLLFRLQSNYNRLPPLTSRLSRIVDGVSLEDRMNEILDDSKDDPLLAKALLAGRFYIREVINQCEQTWTKNGSLPSNYTALLGELRRVRGTIGEPLIVTFNYDRMLEAALSHFDQPITSMHSYTAPNRPSLIKVHGSVDWWQRYSETLYQQTTVTGPNRANPIIESWAEGTDLKPMSFWEKNISPLDKGISAIPSIAVPLRTKVDFMCPPEHLEFLKEKLPEVTGILTLGWRGAENHFLSMLKESSMRKVHMMSVGGPDAGETIASLKEHIRTVGVPATFTNGFSQFLNSGQLRTFLDRMQT